MATSRLSFRQASTVVETNPTRLRKEVASGTTTPIRKLVESEEPADPLLPDVEVGAGIAVAVTTGPGAGVPCVTAVGTAAGAFVAMAIEVGIAAGKAEIENRPEANEIASRQIDRRNRSPKISRAFE